MTIRATISRPPEMRARAAPARLSGAGQRDLTIRAMRPCPV